MSYIKIKEDYKPVTYVLNAMDFSWDSRSIIEVTAQDVSYEELKKYFENGRWSLYDKTTKQVPDEPVDEETPKTYHEEVEYTERDMSEYCVCGYVRDNMDGSSTVRMGKLSETEKIIQMMLGGLVI